MRSRFFAFLLCTGVAICGLNVAGYLSPGSLNWGFHLFGFLPGLALFIYIMLCLGLVLICIRYPVETWIEKLGEGYSRKPFLFTAGALVLCIGFLYLFRVRTPLLGDSFVFVNNLENAINGSHALYIRSEPLSLLFWYAILKTFGLTHYPSMMSAFYSVNCFLGISFILVVYGISRTIFSDRTRQVMLTLSIVTLPLMQLFMGYVEVYSVSVLMVGIFVLCSLLYLQGRLSFFVVIILFIIQVSFHYLNIINGVAFLYLFYHYYRSKGAKPALMAAFIMTAAVTVFAVTGEIGKFLPGYTSQHLLTLKSSGDSTGTYSILSPYHAADLFNIFLLQAPFAIPIILFILHKKPPIKTDHAWFFTLGIIPGLLFLVLGKFDLGMAKDWDVTAGIFFTLSLFTAVLVLSMTGNDFRRAFSFLIAFTALNSLPWYYINASVDANVSRVRALRDLRNVSRDGYYQSTYHLTRYYTYANLLSDDIQLWTNYINLIPEDWKGYNNLISSIVKEGDAGESRFLQNYQRWLNLSGGDARTRNAITQYLFERGKYHSWLSQIEQGRVMYQRVLAIKTEDLPALNEMGNTYARGGDFAAAVFWYKKTISADPNSPVGYLNTGNMFYELKNTDSALFYYQASISCSPGYARAYENIAHLFLEMKKPERALQYFSKAAQLGSESAREYLRMAANH